MACLSLHISHIVQGTRHHQLQRGGDHAALALGSHCDGDGTGGGVNHTRVQQRGTARALSSTVSYSDAG
jgi:hypothetical protein